MGLFKKEKPSTSEVKVTEVPDGSEIISLQDKPEPEVVVAVEPEPEVNYDQQIHDTIYSAQQALLEEAKKILNIPFEYDDKKVERLRKLKAMGFSQAEEVKQQAETDGERKKHEDMQATIAYYQQHYPLYRFIDKATVKTVCEKYGLLLTDVGSYISDIPDKNQDEIVNFQIIREETRCPSEVFGNSWDMFGPDWRVRQYGFEVQKEQEEKNPNYMKESIAGRDLLIIAPINKLDTKGKEIEGHILREKIKDPIVLQSVNGKPRDAENGSQIEEQCQGYLIITAWGLEASDPAVTNAINN